MYIWFSSNESNLDYKLKIRSTIPGEWGRVAATIHKLHQMTKKVDHSVTIFKSQNLKILKYQVVHDIIQTKIYMRWTPTFNEECLNCVVYRHRSFQPPRQHVLGEFQLRDGPRSQRPTG